MVAQNGTQIHSAFQQRTQLWARLQILPIKGITRMLAIIHWKSCLYHHNIRWRNGQDPVQYLVYWNMLLKLAKSQQEWPFYICSKWWRHKSVHLQFWPLRWGLKICDQCFLLSASDLRPGSIFLNTLGMFSRSKKKKSSRHVAQWC